MGPQRGAPSAPGHDSKKSKRVKTLEEKVELLDMLRTAKSASAVARHYGINESTIRYIKKKEKEIREAVAAATPAGAKTLRHVRDPYLSHVENATYLWVQDFNKIGVPIDSIMIRKQAKTLYTSLKARDRGEGASTTSMDFQASKGWFDNFRRRFGLRNVKKTRDAASADQEAAQEFPKTLKKLIEEKGYLPEHGFNADEPTLFSKKDPTEDGLFELIVPKAEVESDNEEDTVPEDNFRRRFGLQNLETNREAASRDQEAAQEFTETALILKKEPTEEDQFELTVPEAEVKPDKEEETDQFTFDNIAEGLRRFKAATDFFYNIDPSMMRSLKVKESVEQAILPYSNIFKEMKKQISQTDMYFRTIPPSNSASPAPATSATPDVPTELLEANEDDPLPFLE